MDTIHRRLKSVIRFLVPMTGNVLQYQRENLPSPVGYSEMVNLQCASHFMVSQKCVSDSLSSDESLSATEFTLSVVET
jgi:hypothetical protein